MKKSEESGEIKRLLKRIYNVGQRFFILRKASNDKFLS